MSDTQIILEVVEGCLEGKHYRFDGPTRILIGRGHGCDIQLSDAEETNASRYHCILDVDPPSIHVRDLDAPMGMLLNGAPIGPPSIASQAELDSASLPTDGEMTDGDELRIGETLIRAHIHIHNRIPDAALAPIYYG
jgi:eukaryotic-like serine/threonine-protein kinase